MITDALFSLEDLESAAELVHQNVLPTPQISWPLLQQRTGCEVYVKHENHLPTGAFKIRGGLVYMDSLRRSGKAPSGVITATRGNHGQSIALAGSQAGISVTILAPHGNSVEKNRAMRALGAELIEFGNDFDEAKLEAARLAEERGLHMVPSFHPTLVKGVATYSLEFLRAIDDLDVVYVPIGMGSGICGMLQARDLLGASTEVIGVVAGKAPSMALSFAEGRAVSTESASTFADGMACREPNVEALEMIRRCAARIVTVSEDAIADAIRAYYRDTHNLAEGAGAAALAALLTEREIMKGKKVGVILTGCNIDTSQLQEVLAGQTPSVG